MNIQLEDLNELLQRNNRAGGRYIGQDAWLRVYMLNEAHLYAG